MLDQISKSVRGLIKKAGWELIKNEVFEKMLYGVPTDYDVQHADTYQKVKSYTMMNSQRIVAVCNAIDYLTKNNIEGDIVACGVWRGGVVMAGIDTLQKSNNVQRNFFLYDTFEGMTTPGHEFDVKTGGNTAVGKTAKEMYKNLAVDDLAFCYASLEEVKENIGNFNYPVDKIRYVKGPVEDTLPKTIPEKIALLYFSISFYESVLHALKHLFPLLVPGGVIIISDYGDWQGTRRAVDEYIKANQIRILLCRIDNSGRIAVKY